jgi:hypothetical protein
MMRRSSSCRLGLLLLPPLVGAFGVKGKLGQQAKEEGRQAEAGSHGHDAPTARARAGRVGSGGGKGSRALSRSGDLFGTVPAAT